MGRILRHLADVRCHYEDFCFDVAIVTASTSQDEERSVSRPEQLPEILDFVQARPEFVTIAKVKDVGRLLVRPTTPSLRSLHSDGHPPRVVWQFRSLAWCCGR